MNSILRNSSFTLALFCSFCFGQQVDFNQKVMIESASQTIDMKTNVVTYQGNVKVTQGTLQIFADQLQILNATIEGQVLLATGKPARYSQILDSGKAMSAQALEVRYELGDKVLLLTGKAQLTQEDSLVKGNSIRYNLQQQLLEAQSKTDGTERVTTIFIPEQIKKQLDEKKTKK